jgi:proteasome lid subunit RPN8/RPN11
MGDIEFGEIGELELAEPPERLLPNLDPKRRVEAMGTTAADDLHIFLRQETLREMVIYSKTEMSRELGGVMIGDFYKYGKTHWLEIAGYVPARHYVNTSASFKFTVESWAAITREKEKRFNDKPIVGWHHTHPRYGIFLSSYDKFIHNHFFNMPWQVALVVDPVAETMGFFQWKHGRIADCGFFYIFDSVAAVR